MLSPFKIRLFSSGFAALLFILFPYQSFDSFFFALLGSHYLTAFVAQTQRKAWAPYPFLVWLGLPLAALYAEWPSIFFLVGVHIAAAETRWLLQTQTSPPKELQFLIQFCVYGACLGIPFGIDRIYWAILVFALTGVKWFGDRSQWKFDSIGLALATTGACIPIHSHLAILYHVLSWFLTSAVRPPSKLNRSLWNIQGAGFFALLLLTPLGFNLFPLSHLLSSVLLLGYIHILQSHMVFALNSLLNPFRLGVRET